MGYVEKIIKNVIGEEIHIFNGDNGPVAIKKLSAIDRMQTGEQYCPDCHKPLKHQTDGYWECPICYWSITDEEVESGDGYPTLKSSYEDDYGYFNSDSDTLDDDDYH